MSKRFNVGRASETGLTAAFLAQSGFTGPTYIFEAKWGGFLGTYAREQQNPEALIQNLGNSFGIMRSGIKPYAACRDIHSSLDVILAAKSTHNLSPCDIERIEIRLIPEMLQMIGGKEPPRNRFEAQLNLRYSIGVALTTGRAFIEEFEAPYLDMKEVLQLAEKVILIDSPELPFDCEPYITITTVSGKTIQGHVEYASGAPQNPLPETSISAKFDSLAGRTLSSSQLTELKNTVLTTKALADCRDITNLLRTASGFI